MNSHDTPHGCGRYPLLELVLVAHLLAGIAECAHGGCDAFDGESCISISSWTFEGGDWFEASSWQFGELFPPSPDSGLRVYIGPSQVTINGVEDPTLFVPLGPAVLTADFSSPSVRVSPFADPAVLELSSGVTYSVPEVAVGQTATRVHQPLLNTVPAKLIMRPGSEITGAVKIGVDDEAVLDVHGSVRIDSLLLAEQIGSHATVNLAGGSRAVVPNGVRLGSGQVVINNAGTVELLGDGQSGNGRAVLLASDSFELRGGGSVLLREEGGGIQGSESITLTNVDNVIRGIGGIQTSFDNQGMVDANGAGVLTLSGSSNSNSGTMLASRGGRLRFSGGTLVNSGMVHAENGSVVEIDANAEIAGGQLASTGSGRVELEQGVLDGVAISGHAVVMPTSRMTDLRGTIANSGVIEFAGDFTTSNSEQLSITTAASLTGGGQIVMKNDGDSSIQGDGTLTNIDNTITAGGIIRPSVVNQGLVQGNGSFSGGFDNQGTLRPFVQMTMASLSLSQSSVLQPTIDSLFSFGTIDASGNIALDGELRPVITSIPNAGDEFVILDAASLTGRFSDSPAVSNLGGITVHWSADYTDTSVVLTALSVGGIEGDYNGDGTIGTDDYVVWRNAFGASSGPELAADGNQDGVVNAADFTLWRDALTAVGAGDFNPVPEPASLFPILALMHASPRGMRLR
ncbi:MAG: dockerin type I domain-containing protein [Planctomycetota bacterium]